ncbi:NAD(P)-dependent oxidoreductase [Marinifilum caeruleilacunae]|uniref:Dihydrofolate reductase n=1 Tax=Marinifilum caeruleilacunae TaxID=2499076 RepID=A0ABX1X1Q8_9BACT|nr:NAD(P)-dependent oxidoreductase [Marinifilum caeruleilacunae]NOU62014.1 dihydrofolate reductase [Marinifilum caeruleilacunae]
MKFKQIVIIDKTGLQDWAIEKLSKLSENPIKIYDDVPGSEEEAAIRIEEADCVFVSWSTQLTAKVLSNAKNLKYVGMCCSLYNKESANVDIDFANNHAITVKGIRDYGDEGLVEYVISELIRLIKGIGEKQWKKDAVELTGRKIGIIGMGATGKMLADRLQAFGAKLYYYNRSRKPQAEKDGIKYLPLNELLESTEIISLHLPKNTNILGEREFKQFGKGKILINTSLGLTFDKSAFDKWISAPSNYGIFDGDGMGTFRDEFDQLENIISSEVVSGWTIEAQERLSKKVLDHVIEFIGNKENNL